MRTGSTGVGLMRGSTASDRPDGFIPSCSVVVLDLEGWPDESHWTTDPRFNKVFSKPWLPEFESSCFCEMVLCRQQEIESAARCDALEERELERRGKGRRFVVVVFFWRPVRKASSAHTLHLFTCLYVENAREHCTWGWRRRWQSGSGACGFGESRKARVTIGRLRDSQICCLHD